MPPSELFDLVPDILPEPIKRRGGGVYKGRFQLANPQWILNPDDRHATVSLTIRDIVTAAENGLIWTDQRVQRGVKPEREGDEPAVQLSLADGYPDVTVYVFDEEKADEITVKLLEGQDALKLSPLVWNLRPGAFQAAVDAEGERNFLYLYKGRIYLPDGHHRHQAILKAYRTWEEAPDEYPEFDPDRAFTVDLYFMTYQEEAEYFFQKNWLPRLVARSKSYDLTEEDPPSVLAKRLIEKTPSLQGNVNRVTDQLSAANPQLLTLSTLREMMTIVVDSESMTDQEIEEIAPILSSFWELLVEVRPELGLLDATKRRDSRQKSMAGQAVTMYGYAELMHRFLSEAQDKDLDTAAAKWQKRLATLAPGKSYKSGKFQGDFFDRDNPLWEKIGVLQRTKSGRLTVSNTRQTRESMAAKLAARLKL